MVSAAAAVNKLGGNGADRAGRQLGRRLSNDFGVAVHLPPQESPPAKCCFLVRLLWPSGLVRLRCGSWGRPNHTIGLGNDFAFGHRHAVVHTAAALTTSVVAHLGRRSVAAAAIATSATVTGVVAAAIARVAILVWVAVEVAPVPFAATRAAPGAGRKQGEEATQRAAVPRAPVTAAAAGISTGVATAVAARATAARDRPSAGPATGCFARHIAIGIRASTRRDVCPANRAPPASRSTVIVAITARHCRAAVAAHIGATAADGLEQTAAGGDGEHPP